MVDGKTPASWLNLIDAALRVVDTEIAALESAAADLRAELARPLPEVRLPGVAAAEIRPAPTAPQPMARAAVVPPARPAAAPAASLTHPEGYLRPAPEDVRPWAGFGDDGLDASLDADALAVADTLQGVDDDADALADLNALGQWGAPTVLGDDDAPVITMAADDAADVPPAVVRKPASRIAAWTSA